MNISRNLHSLPWKGFLKQQTSNQIIGFEKAHFQLISWSHSRSLHSELLAGGHCKLGSLCFPLRVCSDRKFSNSLMNGNDNALEFLMQNANIGVSVFTCRSLLISALARVHVRSSPKTFSFWFVFFLVYSIMLLEIKRIHKFPLISFRRRFVSQICASTFKVMPVHESCRLSICTGPAYLISFAFYGWKRFERFVQIVIVILR